MAKKSKKQRRNDAKRLQRQAQIAEANMRKAQGRVLANHLKESATRKKNRDLKFDLKVNLAAGMSKYNVKEAEVGETPYQVKLWVKTPKRVRQRSVYVESNVVVNLSKEEYQRYKKVVERAHKARIPVPVITAESFGDLDAHLSEMERRTSPEYLAMLNSLATFNFLTSVVEAYPPELQYAIARAMIEHPEEYTNEAIGERVKEKGRDLLDYVYGSDNPEVDKEARTAIFEIFEGLEEYYNRAVEEGYSAQEYRTKMRYLNHRALRTFED